MTNLWAPRIAFCTVVRHTSAKPAILSIGKSQNPCQLTSPAMTASAEDSPSAQRTRTPGGMWPSRANMRRRSRDARRSGERCCRRGLNLRTSEAVLSGAGPAGFFAVLACCVRKLARLPDVEIDVVSPDHPAQQTRIRPSRH